MPSLSSIDLVVLKPVSSIPETEPWIAPDSAAQAGTCRVDVPIFKDTSEQVLPVVSLVGGPTTHDVCTFYGFGSFSI